MLSWFKRLWGADVSAVRSARGVQRMLAAAPQTDPDRCLDEIRFWTRYGSDRADISARALVGILQALDAAAQPHLRKQMRDYLALPDRQHPDEARLWLSLSGYHRTALDACWELLEGARRNAARKPAETAWTLCAAIRHLNALRKLMFLRYQAPDTAVWEKLATLARRCRDFETRAADAGEAAGATRELLRGLLFDVSMWSNMSAERIEIADRVMTFLSDDFQGFAAPDAEPVFVFDLDRPGHPQRLRSGEAADGKLRFGPGRARDRLAALADALNAGQLEPGLRLEGAFAASEIQQTLQHLQRHWSDEPPRRRSERQDGLDLLRVVQGFDAVHQRLRGGRPALEGDADAEPGVPVANWMMLNHSPAGYGALIPRAHNAVLRVGTLLGLTPGGGGRLDVGLVRRIGRDNQLNIVVGIQLLCAGQARAVSVEDHRQANPAFAAGAAGEFAAIHLPADPTTQAPERLLAPPGLLLPNVEFHLRDDGGEQVVLLGDWHERGQEYEIIEIVRR